MKNEKGLKHQLVNLINEVVDKLGSDSVINLNEFIDNREYGLAFEILCTQLHEYNISISSDFYEKISVVGELMGIKPFVWINLKELINNNKKSD